ncbi:hypothetical protein KBX06_00005 [Micromonospora sp. C31]|uniref:hypothetical protein n=1 Tax=Micromonospora sp. C31 TaxID=2824876 RepID=UPI001B385729|nr:hypothetical protein [Micromonospora sp. C31]MBQ1071556.1 hypothetical protein [Micromonospora sp. C31]
MSEVIKEELSGSTITHAELRRSLLSWEVADRPITTPWRPARLLPASRIYPVSLAIATPYQSVLALPGSPASLGVSATSLVPLSAGCPAFRVQRESYAALPQKANRRPSLPAGRRPPAVARS